MINKNLNYLLVMLVLFIISPLFCFAEISAVGDFVNLALNPPNPSPGQQIVATVNSLSINLDSAQITWYINGQEKRTEMGLKDFYVQAGTAGKVMTVGVLVKTSENTIIKKELSFIPAGVDLIFEAVSYVPPFYKGKSLSPKQGMVTVVAFPEMFDLSGKKISTNKIIYTWKKDGLTQADISGLGKNYLTFSGSIPARDVEIEVTASTPDQKITAVGAILVKNVSPKIIFYEDNPIYGVIFNRAIKNLVKMTADEFKVKSFPYFMSVGYTQSPDLDYKWSINGNSAANLEGDKSSMLFRQNNPGAGTAVISLGVNNISRIFQFTDSNFLINFEKQ
jgi:hypothetical protein